jgi:hypothetical protein
LLAEEPALKPSELMRAILAPPGTARLTGHEVSLGEVVAGAASRGVQSLRIDVYWDLSACVADYYLGLREQDELRRLKALVPSAGAAWQNAEAELGIRIGTAQRAAVASQHRLASLVGADETSELPLPSDLPHCGDYYTRYDQVFAGRSSKEAQHLSDLLPLRFEELKAAAAAVARAEERLDTVTARRTASTDGTGSLRAHELLALRRRAFVEVARDYNQRIARYTELATPGPIDAEQLVGMLIIRQSPDATTQSASEPVTQTFSEGWSAVDDRPRTGLRDEGVQPASAESRQTRRPERSLLVPSE